MGAANTFREIGVWEGIIVFLVDATKGAAAIFIAQSLNAPELWVLGAGFAALVGHNYPVFLRFKGGIGSATAIGIFLILVPKEMCIAFGIMVIPLLITRDAYKIAYILAIGFVFMPLLIWLFQNSAVLALYSLVIIIFIGLKTKPKPRKILAKVRRKIK